MSFDQLTETQQKNVDRLSSKLKKLTTIINKQIEIKSSDPSYDLKRAYNSERYYSKLLANCEEVRRRRMQEVEDEYQRVKSETEQHLIEVRERIEKEKASKSRSQISAETELENVIQQWKSTIPIPIPLTCLPVNFQGTISQNSSQPNSKMSITRPLEGVVGLGISSSGSSENCKIEKKDINIQNTPSIFKTRKLSDSDESVERAILKELYAPIMSEEEAIRQSRIARGLIPNIPTPIPLTQTIPTPIIKQEIKIIPSLTPEQPPPVKKKAVKRVSIVERTYEPPVLDD